MPQTFISYRHADSEPWAHRIAEALKGHFGEAAVFLDDWSIELGADFPSVIRKALADVDVLVAVIGKGWLSVKAEDGEQRRIDAPGDLLRAEIQAALEGPLKVIPLLVEGASMPSKDELPVDIRDLANREALEVPRDFFHEAMARLIRSIEDSPRPGVPELKVFLGPDAGMLSNGWEMFLPQRTGIVTLPNEIAPWREGLRGPSNRAALTTAVHGCSSIWWVRARSRFRYSNSEPAS